MKQQFSYIARNLKCNESPNLKIIRNFIIALFCTSYFSTSAESIEIVYSDLPTPIYSNCDHFTSFRYMRHLWRMEDGSLAAVVQQGGYQNQAVSLFKTFDEGVTWEYETQIMADEDVIVDGALDGSGSVLLVTSLFNETKTTDVTFIKLTHEPAIQTWLIDPATPRIVFASGLNYRASRASIAVDSTGIVWCAYRVEDINNSTFNIQVSYSLDGGLSWQDSGFSFGTSNSLPQKCTKLIAVDSCIFMIFHDEIIVNGSANRRLKCWAYREDRQSLETPWTYGTIAEMVNTSEDPFGSHWCVAPDDYGNLFLSYQDDGINIVVFFKRLNRWSNPQIATYGGNYSNISVSENSDVYHFAKNRMGTRIIFRYLIHGSYKWSNWSYLSSQNQIGYLRMDSPERFTTRLPLLYQINMNAPFQMLHCLLDTLP